MREETIKIGQALIIDRDENQKRLDKAEDALSRDNVYITIKTTTGNPLLTINDLPIIKRTLDHYIASLKSSIAITNQHIQELE